jgi:hypothetical protein
MIKLSKNAKTGIYAMLDWYNLSPKKVKDFKIYISKEWGSVKVSQNSKAVLNFFKGGEFSYEGQPKAAAQALCNLLNDKELLNSLDIII